MQHDRATNVHGHDKDSTMGSIDVKSKLSDGCLLDKDVDFSRSRLFDLNKQKPNKTVDIGNDGLSLSLDAKGRVLLASTYHPTHGIIMANPFASFDGSRFHDVPYVRTYRKLMLRYIDEDRPGFGLDFGTSDHHVSINIVNTNLASYEIKTDSGIEISLTARIFDAGVFVQYAKATNTGLDSVVIPYALRLNVSLNRASYGQLTEGGPIPLPPSRNVLQKRGASILRIANPNLGAQLLTSLDVNGKAVDTTRIPDQEASDAILEVAVAKELSIPSGGTATFCAIFRLIPDTEERPNPFQGGIGVLRAVCHDSKRLWKHDTLFTTYVIRRNVEYILANCAVQTSESKTVILADHVALPLGWNRDNYWQVYLLLEAHASITDLMYPDSEEAYKDKIKLAAQGHLSWVFTQAERPRGFWHRSYLANGKPKDQSIFQLDQQCYPLLELCEYLTHFPEDEEFVKSIVETGVIQELLRMLNAKQDKQTMLWPTDETPGDDRAEFPHHFSSHVLLWRTFTRLHELFARLEMPLDEQTSQLDVAAAQLKKRTTEAFKATPPDSDIPLFAYLTNGCGRYTFYHDGNDVPTLFAKDWGFVSSREDICTWKATMDFALSPANEEGYCKGIPYGGLGSVHSPGAWTLGYFQEMAYAASNNNTPAVQGAWTKIAAAMLWDGTFPEAVDPTTAACTSKAWFSWPGAMIGALLIRMRKNGQEETLLQMGGM